MCNTNIFVGASLGVSVLAVAPVSQNRRDTTTKSNPETKQWFISTDCGKEGKADAKINIES